MSDTKVAGVVHLIEETKSYGQKGFQKRLVVLEQKDGRFSNFIPLEFTRDACSIPDDMNVGDNVEISYKLSGRKWQRDANSEVKWFLSAEAISFKKLSGDSDDGMDQSVPDDANDAFADASYDEGDIPF